jgi:hypothetical protein
MHTQDYRGKQDWAFHLAMHDERNDYPICTVTQMHADRKVWLQVPAAYLSAVALGGLLMLISISVLGLSLSLALHKGFGVCVGIFFAHAVHRDFVGARGPN